MNISPRQVKVFIFGILVGALTVGGAWMALGSRAPSPSDATKTSGAAPRSAATATGASARQRAACPAQTATTSAGGSDGQFEVQTNLSSKTAADIAAYLTVGKETAAAGRPRDAEVSFLMSCLVADKLKGSDSVEAADARYQLGRHYATVALVEGPAATANRPELLKRSEFLYAQSLQTYLARFGEGHERSRFAAEGLATVRQLSGQGSGAPAAPAATGPDKPAQTAVATASTEPGRTAQQSSPMPSQPIQQNAPVASQSVAPPVQQPAQEAVAVQQPRMAEVAQAAPAESVVPRNQAANVAPVAPRTADATTRPGPSFDCARARSPAEKLICADAELSQLDRELGRVYARAKNSTSDSAAFRRQNDQEWRRREANCRDRACLLEWYAQRRNQLINELNGARGQARPTASR